jgi:diguanylate cyclase (GGDEF)-like protein
MRARRHGPSSLAAWARGWARRQGALHRVRLDANSEREFREWYSRYVRSRVRAAMWLPMLALLMVLFAPGPFTDLRDAWFGNRYTTALEVLRFAVVLPSTAAILIIAYTGLYRRYYSFAAQIVAPLHGVCLIAIDIMMRSQGYSLSAWMVLVVLASYFMYGMPQEAGLRSAATVLAAYIGMGLAAGLDSPQWRMDLAAISFAATFAGYVFYSLHQAVRASYVDHREMADHANRDALTGIHNRRMFDRQVALLWAQAQRERTALGLLIADIDHFKSYNDTLGHQAGDECLTRMASLIASVARRPLDIAARFGGEEFAIVLYGADRVSMEELASALQVQVSEAAIPHPASPVQSFVTVSIGGACVLPAEGRSVHGFIQLADEALYTAKERGRNRAVIMDQEYEFLKTGVFRGFRVRHEAVV